MRKILIAILVLLLVIIGGVTVWFFFSDDSDHATISSKAKLLELLGLDFTDIEITDIQYENGEYNNIPYTNIVMFYNDSEEALQFREYYLRERDLSCISPPDIRTMEEMGVDTDSILQHGRNFKDYIAKSGEQRPYGIYWYELDKSYGYKGNVLILTSIDATIKIDVEKILKD